MKLGNTKLASDKEVNNLLDAAKNSKKYTALILLMLDGGMRVSEAISLKFGSIDFGSELITIASLKKKSDNPIYRQIPISYRLLEALCAHCDKKDFKSNDFIFPSNSKTGHVERSAVRKWIKRRSSMVVSPHMLRHTFGTRVVKSKGVLAAQKLLGHSSSATTEIYTHLHLDELKDAIESIDNPKFIERVRRRVKGKNFVKLESANISAPKELIGRRNELVTLSDSMSMKVNTYVQGPAGIGKSKLIESIKGDNVIFLDDFRQIKKTLTNLLEHLIRIGKSEVISAKYNNCLLYTSPSPRDS